MGCNTDEVDMMDKCCRVYVKCEDIKEILDWVKDNNVVNSNNRVTFPHSLHVYLLFMKQRSVQK
jgi:hypothetical protein